MLMRKSFLAALGAAMLIATPVHAAFHVMQIEKIIGGVDGDPTAQAIQLRLRANGQNVVANSRIRVHDAAGANPITVIDIASNVPNGVVGRRVLITSASFDALTNPVTAPDFTLTNLIPASYLAAGSLTFEADGGVVYWRVSWGGASYTGSNAGNITNDPDGDFGPAFPAALPSAGRAALTFQGPANAQSSSNAADYAIEDAPTVTNNANASFVLEAGALLGDMNCDGTVSVGDIGGFVLALTDPAGYAAQFPDCDINNADINGDMNVSVGDIGLFVALLTGG